MFCEERTVGGFIQTGKEIGSFVVEMISEGNQE
jgi:hypothetical protein